MTSRSGSGLAGYEYPDGSSSAGEPLSASRLYVPTPITLDGDCLVWDDGEGHYVTPALADAKAETILHFARRWGVLRLCKQHLLPISHSVRGFKIVGEGFSRSGCTRPRCAGGIYEPIQSWRDFARLARVILMVTAAHARGGQSTAEERHVLRNAPFRPVLRLGGDSTLVLGIVNSWLKVAGVSMSVTSRRGGRSLEFSGGLFGAIGMRLAAAVSGTPDFAYCHGCKKFYVPKRTPASGRRTFCDRVRCKRASLRIAKADGRRKAREQAPRA
jgi:hypothetical protein